MKGVALVLVPVLWDTGGDISRKPPYAASPALQLTLRPSAVKTNDGVNHSSDRE